MRHLAVVLLLLAATAAAHDADVIYVSATDGAAPGAVLEVVTLTAGTLGQLAPVDADGDGMLSQADLDARAAAITAGVWAEMPLSADRQECSRSGERAELKEGYVELTATFTCPKGERRQDFRILRVISSNYRVVLGTQLEGESGKAFVQMPQTSLVLPSEHWETRKLFSVTLFSFEWLALLAVIAAVVALVTFLLRRRRRAT